ncbi:glycerophosphodiester phosphodiesterase [Lactiplantibacillus plantarum]|uniref:glycerophosphodiester phosphodiesterase n=1 Tax=Lactiplantibacillus plantarum TaxID=1590 RepID=UPI0014170D4A|nr:glycerophosphodiester phosphodiesterase family protein [Lactiplantibacillus plantarum]
MAKTLSFTDTSAQTVKIGDTTTSFTLICGNDNVPTDLTKAASITAKLGNNSGYLKSATIAQASLTDPTTGQVTVKFSADLMNSLPAGNYYIEVWVVDSNGTSIYPSDGTVGFTINNNIQSTNGSTITTITFDDFVEAMNKAASTIAKGEIADSSVGLDKLTDMAIKTTFVPSRDGAPQLDSHSLVLDFNAKSDYPFIITNEDHIVQIPLGSKVTFDFSKSSVVSILANRKTGVVTAHAKGAEVISDGNIIIGYLRNAGGQILVSGAISDTLMIDNVPNKNYFVGSGQITLTPSAYGVPNFNSKTMSVDFLSKSDSQVVITKGRVNYIVPAGLIAQPTGSIVQNGGRSFKLWYNTANSVAWVTSYGDKPTDSSLLLGQFFAAGGVIRSSINMTIDGHFPDEEFFSFTPSNNGNPFYDVKTNTLDFNCYTDKAYVRYNGVNKPIPINYYINVPELIAGSTARILYNPTSNTFSTTGWQASIPVGYIQVASIRLTRTSGAISQGAFQIDYLGNHGNNGYIKQSKFIKQIAHRGYNVSAPEQSKLAYTIASTYGVNEWEGDIQFTLDNVPVLWHDDNIKGYALDSNGNALTSDVLISQTNYADLIKYDFGSGKSTKYKGTPILSVEEMFKLARIYDANMHLEFKNDYDDNKIQNLVNLVNKYGVEPNLSWQSFNSTYFSRVVKLLPKVPLEFLTMLNDDNEVTRLLADMDSFKSDGRNLIASADSYNSSVDRVNRVTDYGYQIYIWTVDDPATVNKFADCLVSGFMTNGGVDVNGTIRKQLMS